MAWHPPIPSEAVYSPEVAKLGAGLRLLLYLYNCIEQDGTAMLSLKKTSQSLGVHYETVRTWWQALRSLGIVTVLADKGKSGFLLEFNPDWIDWHVHAVNYSGVQRAKNTVDDTLNNSERATQPVEGCFNGSSIDRQRAKNTVDDNAYKVLNLSEGGSEDRDRTARTHPPAIALLLEVFPGAEVSAEQTDDICSTVTDLVRWQSLLRTWRANGYKPRPGNMLDRYRKEQNAPPDRPFPNGSTHVARRAPALPSVDEAIPARAELSADERRRALERARNKP